MNLYEFKAALHSLLDSFGYVVMEDGTKSKGYSITTAYKEPNMYGGTQAGTGGTASFRIMAAGEGFIKVEVRGYRSQFGANVTVQPTKSDGIVLSSIKLPATQSVVPALLGWVANTMPKKYEHLNNVAVHDTRKRDEINATLDKVAKARDLVNMSSTIKTTIHNWLDRGFEHEELEEIIRDAIVDYTMKS
jgi:hypothetical protein